MKALGQARLAQGSPHAFPPRAAGRVAHPARATLDVTRALRIHIHIHMGADGSAHRADVPVSTRTPR
jgi:hypothetical protein